MVLDDCVGDISSFLDWKQFQNWVNTLEDFLKSGLRNRQVRWVAESPSFDTARASLQKLTRRQGKKKNDEVIPAGEYLGKVKVTGVKEKDAKGNVINCYIWFVNVLKQKEWEESETVGKPKKGKK